MRQLGDIQDIVLRGVEESIPPSEALSSSIVSAVDRGESLSGAISRVSKIKWNEEIAYASSARDTLILSSLFGHVEVWMDGEGISEFQASSWSSLPFKEAIEYFLRRTKILTPRAFRALSDAARAKSWTISGDHNDYTRRETKKSLKKAIADGLTKSEWIDQAEEMFEAMGVVGKGKHHLETVFDTNTLSSYNNGRWRQQNTPIMIKLRPLLRYATVGDRRVRSSHASMSGFTARRDHPTWSTWYPPNGFRCRCTVDAISDDGSAVSRRKKAPGKPDEGWSQSPKDFWDSPIPPPRQRVGPTQKRTGKQAKDSRTRG